MHRVLVEVVRLERAECAEADVEHEFDNLHALPLELFKNSRGKVQRCRRRCDAARIAGEDRLITGLRFRRIIVDIRRQRQRPGGFEKLFKLER